VQDPANVHRVLLSHKPPIARLNELNNVVGSYTYTPPARNAQRANEVSASSVRAAAAISRAAACTSASATSSTGECM
jgi:hypothetical protein